MTSEVHGKIRRLATGCQARVLDLFSGCGGLSLGFHRAGFDIVAAMEIDRHAARSHARNFFRDDPAALEHHARPRDITQIEPADLVADLGLGATGDAIDFLIGGPPCQAYARVGRAKLREVMDHPEAFKVDPRGNLYLRYLHYVSELKPLGLLMENVPDIMNYGGHNVVQEMVEALDQMGYNARYSLLNSSHYGVPQTRDRVFLIGFRKELKAQIRLPPPTHRWRLPAGYERTRQVALRHIDTSGEKAGYVQPDVGGDQLPAAISAQEALMDLPSITLHLEGRGRTGARHFNELSLYPSVAALSGYAREMRDWKGFEAGEGVYDHVVRNLPRDISIFRDMAPGDEYPAAHRVATRLFEQEARARGLEPAGAEWVELHRKMVPPYPVGSFPNRWWKLRRDAPVRTLMAHIGKDTYSHIHYDGSQARVISVREAARLQSFPDGFVFDGTMNPAYRQIGNAVPPLMAFALARAAEASLIAAVKQARQVEPA